MDQLQRAWDGTVYDVLGTSERNKGVDAVWLGPGGPWYFSREQLERDFIAYPPQEKKPVGGPLMRYDIHGGEHVFDVMAVAEHGGGMWLQSRDKGCKPTWMERNYVQEFFTAYPPQPTPDRVDQLMQETDGWEPLTAYQVTFCPADNVALEPGKRVVEAYAGALINASQCPVCNRFFADDTLTEIKL